MSDHAYGEYRHCIVTLAVIDTGTRKALSVDTWEGELFTGAAPVESLLKGLRSMVEACAGIDALTAAHTPPLACDDPFTFIQAARRPPEPPV